MAEVRLEVELTHPPERVWRALTEARLLGEWFMPTDLEPREGTRFTLDPGTLAGFLGLVSGELTELAAPHRMVMLWQGEKLHTRVAWEVTATAGGSRLEVVQTGFIGAPAALRRRALRDTYTRLFAERLPVVLDQLAAGTADFGGSAAGAVAGAGAGAGAPGVVVPRQRRPRSNVAVGAWAAGRTLAPPEDQPDGSGGGTVAVRPASGTGPAGSGPEATGEPAATRPELTRRRIGMVLHRELWEGIPGWIRASAIGAAAALFAVVVLAVVTYPSGRDAALGDPSSDPGGSVGRPGVALQPGAATSGAGPAGSVGPAGEPGAGPAEPSGMAGGDPTAGLPGTPPGSPGPVERTSSPGPTAGAGPVLTARWTSSAYGLLGLGGRRVSVTVSNPGPGSAPTWEVTMDVGDQAVERVSGAELVRDGSVVIFTPAGGALAGYATAEFTLDIPSSGLLGLGGTDPPTGCTIDGQPCG